MSLMPSKQPTVPHYSIPQFLKEIALSKRDLWSAAESHQRASEGQQVLICLGFQWYISYELLLIHNRGQFLEQAVS